MEKTMFALLVLALIVFIALWPWAIIWALNLLFPLLSIPYSFFSWLAVVVLNISTFGGIQATLTKINNKLG